MAVTSNLKTSSCFIALVAVRFTFPMEYPFSVVYVFENPIYSEAIIFGSQQHRFLYIGRWFIAKPLFGEPFFPFLVSPVPTTHWDAVDYLIFDRIAQVLQVSQV